jgi:hypothetical protein
MINEKGEMKEKGRQNVGLESTQTKRYEQTETQRK